MRSKQSGNKSLYKVLAILDAFTGDKPWLTITELSTMVEIPRVSLYRMVVPLVEHNYLQFDAKTNRYALGVTLFRLGQTALKTLHFGTYLTPVLDEVAGKIPHTITVGILRNNQIVYIDKRESNSGLKIGADIGSVLPVYRGAIGKIFLSHMPPQEAETLIEQAKNDPDCILDPKEFATLKDSLPQIRANGFVLWPGETTDSVIAMAGPIYDHNRELAAGLAFLIPRSLGTSEECERCKAILLDACSKISHCR